VRGDCCDATLCILDRFMSSSAKVAQQGRYDIQFSKSNKKQSV